ncbi:MAG: DUF2703 domain-containing protein [Candidatus Eisenbacteria bacterium]
MVASCGRSVTPPGGGEGNLVLRLDWQRLVTEDDATCDRCSGTQEELRQAAAALRKSLGPLGIEVAYVEQALSREECAADILRSNRILIQDRPLEDWLGGEMGASTCGSCCEALGEQVECRTASVDGVTYEVIPVRLIVRAGLLAASNLMRPPSSSPCCPGAAGSSQETAPCSPEPTNCGGGSG